jgi:phosphoserine phosphatase
MAKPTLIFDFDSTLIRGESLELILAAKLKDLPKEQTKIAEITRLGMEGKISFSKSLEKRLRIAAPSKVELEVFGKNAIFHASQNISGLLLWARNHFDIWILSGGLYESLIGFAENFSIQHVYAVKLLWTKDNQFLGINKRDAFSKSKVEGARVLAKNWQSPSIMVGDGFTDYQVFQEGLVDHFIAFTQNVRRDFINKYDINEAKNVSELKQKLAELAKLRIEVL